MQEAQQAGPSSGVIGARALTGVNHDLEEGQSLTGSEYSGSFNGSVTTLASHSYTTGYRTSFAGTDAGSDAGSYVSQSQGLKRSMSRLGSSVKHYAKLMVAEHPVKEHRKYKQGQEAESRRGSLLGDIEESDEEEAQASNHIAAANLPEASAEACPRNVTAVKRWQLAKDSVISATAMHREADTVADSDVRGKDRFIALVRLEQKLADNPNKKLLMAAIAKKRLGQFDSFFDHLHTEMIITGQVLFDACTPAKVGQHRLYFTFTFIFVVFMVFFYMIGEFPFFVLQQPHDSIIDTCLSNLAGTSTSVYGPSQMTHWFNKGAKWCFGGNAWIFSPSYLLEWGAKYGPAMKAQPYRWFTSWFVHESFQHVLSNMLLFGAIACQIEEKYGAPRIVLLFFISALGGSFFSGVCENGCEEVVGASGGCFGMMGLFIADMIMNFESIPRPVLRCCAIVAFTSYFIITIATQPIGTSHMSHVGGLICGLFPAFVFLPNLHHERWEAILPIAGALFLVIAFITLPVVFYQDKFPHLNCPTAT